MDNQSERLRDDVSSSLHQLAKAYPQVQDAQMLVGASEATASLQRQVAHRSVDVEWIQMVEQTIPYLDLVIRHPTVMIEDVEEVTPVELARHISEKSIRHLAQHSNLILDVKGDEVIPSKILNIRRDESILTYENKFINTLITRLFNFVSIRYQAISQGYGTQQTYELHYDTAFQHGDGEESSNVKIGLHMQLDTPVIQGASKKEKENNESYAQQVARAEQIYHTVASFTASKFVKKMGNNYIRPPVIRTNAILKNKNMNACLGLWEYIESYDKAGYTEIRDAFHEMPSDEYIRGLYMSVALQYVQFYNDVLEDQAANRLLAEQHLDEIIPYFSTDEIETHQEDYDLLDTHYEKIVPISRLMNSRKKLSPDELKIRSAIDIAIKADQELEKKRLAEEARRRRIAEEEEARRLAEEEEARRIAEEKKRLEEEAEAKRIAEEEEAKRLAEEEERLRQEEETRRAAELEAQKQAEIDAQLVAEELEALRLAAEEEAAEQAIRDAAHKAEMEAEAARIAEEQQIAADLAAAENLFYHSREEYISLPRKKKKKILSDLKKLHDYEAALVKQSDAVQDVSPASMPLPTLNQNWDEIRRWERSVLPSKKS